MIKFLKILSETFSKKQFFSNLPLTFLPSDRNFLVSLEILFGYTRVNMQKLKEIYRTEAELCSSQLCSSQFRHDKIGNCACAEIVMPLSARGFKSVNSKFVSLGASFALMTFFTFEKVKLWVDRCLSKNVTSFVFKSLDHWYQI